MEYNRMKNWIVRIYEAAYPDHSVPNMATMLRQIFDYVVHGRNERQRAERLRASLVKLYEAVYPGRICVPFEPDSEEIGRMVNAIGRVRIEYNNHLEELRRKRLEWNTKSAEFQKHSDELNRKLSVANGMINGLRTYAKINHDTTHADFSCSTCKLLRETAAFLSGADAVSDTHIFEHKLTGAVRISSDAAKGTAADDELTRLRAENERLKTLNHRLYERNDRLMTESERLITENVRLISNQSPPVIKIEGVPNVVLRSHIRENERLSKRLTELKGELFQACDDRNRFESERNTARKAYALQEEMNKVRANQSPPAVEADNACLRVENEQLSRQISSISAELGNSKQAYAFLQEEMNKVRAVFRKADFVTEEMAPSECAESLRKERETLRGKLADFETANNLLKSVKERKANRIAYLKAQICRLRNDLNDLTELPE